MTGITRKDLALLAPPVVTTTSAKPGKRLLGTGATILVSLHDVGMAVTPPIVTLLAPWVVPKPEPLMVNDEPTGLTGPTDGERLVMFGEACQAWALKQKATKRRKITGRVLFRICIQQRLLNLAVCSYGRGTRSRE
jgi:hypothetical protein